MISGKRPVPRLLLPSPESDYILVEETQTGPSPEQLFPPDFEEIIGDAAIKYISDINAQSRFRGGQAVLPLTVDGRKRATGIIFDALRLNPETKGLTVIPSKPKELQRAIKTGLELRREEMATGQSLIAQLKQIGKTGGGKPVFFDLGLDKELIDAATEETFRYPIIPQPENARKLMAMVPARRQAVGQMAVTAATGYMAENQGALSEAIPVDEFIALNLGLVSDLLITADKQAPVDRGEFAAGAIGLIKKGEKLNPTFIEPPDLKLVIKAFSDPKIVSETPAIAAKTAAELLAHSPELIPTGMAALKAFGGQIYEAVNLAQKAAFSRKDDRITLLTINADIFKILPTTSMLDSGVLITKADLLSRANRDTHHLWENAIEIAAGPNRSVLIPSPEKLVAARAFLSSIKTPDGRLNDSQERLWRAINAWRKYTLEKSTLPGKIKKLDVRIKEMDKSSGGKYSSSVEIQDLHPIQLDKMILAKSGEISALTGKINRANTVLKNHRELSTVAGSTAPGQFGLRFLVYRQKQAARRQEAFEKEENTALSPEHPFLFTDFAASEETPAEELIRIRDYLDELEADKTKPLPQKFMADHLALYNYLRLGQKRLLPGKHGRNQFDKVNTGMSILLNAKGDDIGQNFWRSWFIGEAKKREHALVTRLERIEGYQADRAEMKVIREALASDSRIITDTAGRLTESKRSVPLDRWIKMQAVPPDFLKKLKGAGKNDQSPESKQLQQAQDLVTSYRDAKGRGVQMRIPQSNQIDKALNDKLRAAKNYKASKIATMAIINQLKLVRKDNNPLVPLDISERATLGELIEATSLRIAVARATRESDELVADRELAKQRIAELKEFRTLKEKAVSIDQLIFQRDARERELKMADSKLLTTMEALNLAAEPEMIPKSK